MSAEDHPLFRTPVPVPAGLRERAAARGWPDGLLQRACDLRVNRGALDFWLSDDGPPPDRVARALDDRARVMFGTLRLREVTWADDDALADLFAHAPEAIGDWDVTVERGPYPFAQFRLQEHVNMQMVEDRGVALAVAAHSTRNTLINNQRLTAHVLSSFRVREGFRGQGYSNLVRSADGPACTWFGLFNYWYVRAGNRNAADWINAILPDAVAGLPESADDVPGTAVTIHHLPARAGLPPPPGVRPARRSDTRRCVALINRTHAGLDLFRPHTPEHLQQRLDDPSWGVKPTFYPRVYGWDDYFVVEDRDGRIVACGGCWDRGAHVREAWRHRDTGEAHTIASAALLDWGYAPGHEPAMASLVHFFLARAARLGRDDLLVPFQHEPELLRLLDDCGPTPETRTLQGQGFEEGDVRITVWPHRPDTDLAYW